jgi:DNA-binding FrmR family transcriptional regulator
MDKKKITIRLRKIEGQIRGIIEMILSDRPLEETIVQFEAVNSSIASTQANYLFEQLEQIDLSDKQKNQKILDLILRKIKKGS